MKKKLIIFLLLIVLIPMNTNVLISNAFTSSAKGMCVLESEDGKVLYAKDMNLQMPMASTTKIVTAITFLDNCQNLNETIIVDDRAIGIEGTSIYLQKGEEIALIDLLYGLMLRSGNDAAMALALHISDNLNDFSDLMKETAIKAGAQNSSFANPHGLDAEEHYTTAYDLAMITRYALENEIFRDIVSTKNYVIESTNISSNRYLTNKNKLLTQLDGCIGVKTGFTSKAGRCLVSAVERDGFRTICVVLNCGPMFEESTTLLNKSQGEYKLVKLIDNNKPVTDDILFDSENKMYYIFSPKDIYCTLLNGVTDDITYKIEYLEDIDIKNGENIANLEIFFKKHLIKSVKLYTIEAMDLLSYNDIPIKSLWDINN